jgi:hypothetical protein
MYEYGTLKPVEIIKKIGRGKRENNGGDKQNWDNYTHMGMSQ